MDEIQKEDDELKGTLQGHSLGQCDGSEIQIVRALMERWNRPYYGEDLPEENAIRESGRPPPFEYESGGISTNKEMASGPPESGGETFGRE